MELVLLIGPQASGKSSFCRERLFHTHVRLNLDMLRTRHRERVLFLACLQGKAPVVIDNTNPTPEDRARYIGPAKEYRFRVVGYFFAATLQECLNRNAHRSDKAPIPEVGIRGTWRRLSRPTYDEGFDELFEVHPEDGQRFSVQRIEPPAEYTE
jgi:predicted kinase